MRGIIAIARKAGPDQGRTQAICVNGPGINPGGKGRVLGSIAEVDSVHEPPLFLAIARVYRSTQLKPVTGDGELAGAPLNDP